MLLIVSFKGQQIISM